MTRPYTVGLICARGGSKGIPRKNLRLLCGKPLLAWAIEVARACPSLDRVLVSTEDPEIAAVARNYHAEVPFTRPLELAQDNSPEILVWQHAIRTLSSLEGKAPEVLVSVPATSPLRNVNDVEQCVAALLQYSADICITVRRAQRSPYFNMVSLADGWATLAVQSSTPICRRQDAPVLYDMTTVAYAARTDFVLRANHLFEGRVRATIVPEDRALDIDSELDMTFGEFMLTRRKVHERSL